MEKGEYYKMLLSLHVKNLALIEEEEVSFSDGLNILTGETGAGKSIIIGSVNLALGAKADAAVIRTGAEYALVELTFRPDNERQRQALGEMGVEISEEDTVLIKRRIYPGRSQCTVEGETVTLKQLREISQLMIDVYGQRENQKLLKRQAQLKVLDDFAGSGAAGLKEKISSCWQELRHLRSEYENSDLDESARAREIDLISYEIREIEEASLKQGEDEELESRYRKLAGFRRLSEAAGIAGNLVFDGESDAASQIERALRELSSVEGIDRSLDEITEQLSEIDSLLSDFSRALSDYMGDLSFDPDEFHEIEERLNLINHLKDKYGASIEKILDEKGRRERRLEDLMDYEAARKRLSQELSAKEKEFLELCKGLSDVRRKASAVFTKNLAASLKDLNFNQVRFETDIRSGEEFMGPDGYDRVTFYISMNPGEAMRPLDEIASGGELSRIMLGLKTVFAGKDEINTFIFDEIDSGISGQTAWKVSEKLGSLAKDHQILCITHLAQIAAMEDCHYLIAKETVKDRTVTHVRRLTEEESTKEVARLLGSDKITELALQNAAQLKSEAAAVKRAV